MNFSGEVIKILDDLGKRFGVAVDWTSQNVLPKIEDLSHRIVQYEIKTSILWIVLSSIAMLLLIAFTIWDLKEDCTEGASLIITIPLAIVCITLLTGEVTDIIKATTIPEVIWINYVKQYIK